MERWNCVELRARNITEAQAETILNKVLDAGINYIDASIDYGLSEEPIGLYISHRRTEYYLASKCGCLVGAPPHSAASGGNTSSPATTSWRGSNKVLCG
jgi:aryl-alcohol dehydrogenase-like predicted oxidoreductase